jgi:branched-chain amino acid transport system substrate-binding protein
MMSRRYRTAVLGVLALLAASGVPTLAGEGVVRIGVINDRNGPYADIAGAGSVAAAQLAVQEFGGTVAGYRIEVVSADHQNKPDVGAAIVRRWFDTVGVDVVVDVITSSVALAVQQLAKDKDKLAIFSGAGSDELTGAACSKNTFVWTWDTYALAHAAGRGLAPAGKQKDWFLIEVDYALGKALERGVRSVLDETGAKISGIVRHPLGTSDFSSYLIQAQASGAGVIALLNGGADAVSAVKQAAEFGVTQSGSQELAALVMLLQDVKALGLKQSAGLRVTESFYWDLNERTRKWSANYAARMDGRMPSMIQAGTYSAVRHYLRAVERAGTTRTDEVAAAMFAMPVDDATISSPARIREDGRLMRDFYVFRVKSPQESRGPWDLYDLIATVPAEEAAIPTSVSSCTSLRKL